MKGGSKRRRRKTVRCCTGIKTEKELPDQQENRRGPRNKETN